MNFQLQLIEKTAKEHPFHVTVIIMALCNVENETSEAQHSTAAPRRSRLSKKNTNTIESGTERVCVNTFHQLEMLYA